MEVRMVSEIPVRRWLLRAAVLVLVSLFDAPAARAQGFISPSVGYNFGGDAGCRTATDCRDKNWNWGGSLGALGSVVGFEAELTYEGEFTGDRPDERTKVTTLMGNFMLAPKITIVQPYGLAGIGLIRTDVESRITGVSNANNQVGWTLGGGLIVYLQRHVGLKGDIRYYHSFEKLDLLGIDFGFNETRIDFGRAGFGVIFKF
jgi:opacity protein-like surface antigen